MLLDGIELRPVPGLVGYFAGTDGRIYSQWRKGQRKAGAPLRSGPPRLLKSVRVAHGYLAVSPARLDGPTVRRMAHILVGLAFHGPCPPGMNTSHLNGSRTDNRPENLKWETHQDNVAHKVEHGTLGRGLANSRTCMSPERIELVRRRLAEGCTHLSIAEEVGVSRSTISRIYNGHRYADA